MILEINDLSAAYGRIQVLWGVSLRVEDKEIVSLIGANGAGKSTLLKSVIGVLKPQAGEIRFRSEDIVGKRPHSMVKAGISYVPKGGACLHHEHSRKSAHGSPEGIRGS